MTNPMFSHPDAPKTEKDMAEFAIGYIEYAIDSGFDELLARGLAGTAQIILDRQQAKIKTRRTMRIADGQGEAA